MFAKLHDISVNFGEVRALNNVSLDISPNQIHAIVGENGASEPSGPRRAVPGIDALGGCPGNCSGHGQCQSQRGSTGAWTTRCACAPGWNGTACEVRDASPCNTPHGGRVLSRYRVRVSRYRVRVRAAC